MIVVGAKGFAKELLEIFHQNKNIDDLYFFDNINKDIESSLYGTFPILKNQSQVEKIFKEKSNKYAIGIGNPNLRSKVYSIFNELGGKCVSIISPYAKIGAYQVYIGEGSIIMTDAIITSNITIGIGSLINKQTLIGHDVTLGDFVEVAPGAKIGGHCIIDDKVFIGMNATILPKIKIGKNAMIAAGAVVTKDVPENCTVAGVPAKPLNKK